MASRATDNLRTYFSKALLPQMLRKSPAPELTPTGRHPNIEVSAQPWRQLCEMRDAASAWNVSLGEMAMMWADEYVPAESLGLEDLDRDTGELFTVPCGPTFEIPQYSGRRPSDISRMTPWIDYLPLMTVQRTLHLLFPKQTTSWSFSLVDDANDKDRNVFRHFVWSCPGPHVSMVSTPLGKVPRYPLVIAFQPPWILSAQDMLEFVRCRMFPRVLIKNDCPTALELNQRLWAKLWDICVQRKTRWFILTSYEQWVFGVFSEGWTIGFVSEVMQFDAQGPTVLEALAFWIACAMRLPGCRSVPKVREEITAGPPEVPVSLRSGTS
ncbi:hypothetical protein B0H15DRAFT_518829 [Mycena belliarum]|uniref:Uncharacterized protein n=1 Tax=Mycena belliarum TaxID=1033014 RepID=A0AAD6TZ97_9AGAR|nr:hypothetical protein B0H15DRAFT_518829 [Mycena belliae]